MIDPEAGGSVDRPQEGLHRAQERLGLFDVRHVARVFKDPSLAVVPTDVVDRVRALSPRFGLLDGLTRRRALGVPC
jgi:hypothetical protein